MGACPIEGKGQEANGTKSELAASAPLVLRTHPIVVLTSTAAASLFLGFILGVVVARLCRRSSSVSVTSSSVSLVKPGDQIAESDTSSTNGENNNLESLDKEISTSNPPPPAKPTPKKTESWPRFSYTGSLGGTLQRVKR